MEKELIKRSRAQESRAAIERLYIVMRHLFNRGYYKPMGASGESLRNGLLTLSPEIYGSMSDPEKIEMNGLLYVMDRLPKGIEECRFIKLTSEEGYKDSHFPVIIPSKRRRNCYRIDEQQMFIEVTRGRSEIYDILTHLTFLYIEAEKIKNNALDEKGRIRREWTMLEKIIKEHKEINKSNKELALTYLSVLLGRTFKETEEAYEELRKNPESNTGLFNIVYSLGRAAMNETFDNLDREISFSSALRQRIGNHIYGEYWAINIKRYLEKHELSTRPVHIISANMHSAMNSFYAYPALAKEFPKTKIDEIAIALNKIENVELQNKVETYAQKNGLHIIPDTSGTNLAVQIIDTDKLPLNKLSPELKLNKSYIENEKPVLFVMDYAFGEQAYETMDELLKPHELDGKTYHMQVESISIMGKAGILAGGKGDIMIPTAHIFEGTADNYPFKNMISSLDFTGMGDIKAFEGAMVTVLGTSLQNRDILKYFSNSSWNVIGLEMEGAHYQKAIQSHTMIRKSIKTDVALRYAYYASDNPLLTGSTLASGSLGATGVKPTYLITIAFINGILG